MTADTVETRLSGPLDVHHLRAAQAAVRTARSVDLGDVTTLDTAGALWLTQLHAKGTELRNLAPAHQPLIDLIGNLTIADAPVASRPHPIHAALERLGKGAYDACTETRAILTFVGQAAVTLAQVLMHPARLRWSSITRHIEETGINALPIVGLIAFLISIVLAYQGVAQLRPYGGERFTVNLVVISVLREMGVLLTAIMVAGRSGSAFTAEIGVMKTREEVDALQVTGIDPFEILVVPRLIALIVTLPLLTFFADMLGIIGGAAISMAALDMSLAQYVQRVHESATLRLFAIGMIKAPVFAFFIGIVGCMHGLRVTGSAESVGVQTTASVVKSIFLVLVLDALFSILFQKLGW
jgi:phospholipid/cholesterol/gamma-HCH transport system permease protein